jgi:hypothetical protein
MKSKMMMMRAALFAGALAVPMSAATSAQPAFVGAGLVNVQVGTIDVIDNVTVVLRDINVNVAAAVQIAANVCGVAVGVIAQDVADGSAACRSVAEDGIVDFVNIQK